MGAFTKRLIRTEARAEERDRAGWPRKEKCADCAWRPGSPEQQDPEEWKRLMEKADPAGPFYQAPFYCHEREDGTIMPVGPDGQYAPKLRPDGTPVGWPMCRGWADAFDVNMKRLVRREKAC
jgi:hypothetical protein